MSRVAPPTALGWTHVWDGGREQLRITDQQAEALVMFGIIEYSGLYRVYRICSPTWTLDRIRDEALVG